MTILAGAHAKKNYNLRIIKIWVAGRGNKQIEYNIGVNRKLYLLFLKKYGIWQIIIIITFLKLKEKYNCQDRQSLI